MKVSQLITLLSELNQDQEIKIWDDLMHTWVEPTVMVDLPYNRLLLIADEDDYQYNQEE